MATTNVACPYCGKETRVTLPEPDAKIKAIKKKSAGVIGGYSIGAGCPEGHSFSIKAK